MAPVRDPNARSQAHQPQGNAAPQPGQPKEAPRPIQGQATGDHVRVQAQAVAPVPAPIPQRNPRVVNLALGAIGFGKKITQLLCRAYVKRLVHVVLSLVIGYAFVFAMVQMEFLDPCFAKIRTGRICISQNYIWKLLSYTEIHDEYTCIFFGGRQVKNFTDGSGWGFGGTNC